MILCPCCNRCNAARWLRTKGVYLGPGAAYLLDELLRPGAQIPRSVGEWGRGTSLRFRMRKKSLPHPSRWLQLARCLRAARLLEGNPGVELSRLAHLCGHADHSGLSHALRRNFGLTPTELRQSPQSFEALIERWWERSQRPVTANP